MPRLMTALLALACTLSAIADQPAERATDQPPWRLGEPVSVRNLTLFPLVSTRPAARKPGAGYITLDEGQKRKVVVVGETGNVPRLKITNNSDKTLFLMAGEMVVGGKQDRIVAVNVTVAPKSSKMVQVFCVEQGRWNRPSSFKSSGTLVHSKLRNVAQSSKDQSKVWQEVSCNNDKMGTRNATSAYRHAVLDGEVGKLMEAYKKGLVAGLKGDRIVGIAVAVGDEVIAADVYATPRLFAAFRDKLVASYAMEAIGRLPEALSTKDVRSLRTRAMCWLAQGESAKAIDDLAAATKLAPREVALHKLRGRLLLSTGRHAEAVVAYDAALAVAPQDTDAVRGRLVALIGARAFRTALTDLERLIAADPKDMSLRTMLGYAYEQLGRPGDAEVAYVRALAISPDDVVARVNRARLLIGRDKVRAKAELEWLASKSAHLLYGGGQRGWGNYARNNDAAPQRAQRQQQLRVQDQEQTDNNDEQQNEAESNKQEQRKVQQANRLNAKQRQEAARERTAKRIATLLAGKAKLPARMPGIALGKMPKIEGSLLTLLKGHELAHAAPKAKAVQAFLDEVQKTPVKSNKDGNFRFENDTCVGFGTGKNRKQMLHSNWHKK